MRKSDDGGPAFPVEQPETFAVGGGMSLRDWFAGQALQGMLANDDASGAVWSAFAKDAYACADAMLAARSKTQGE